MSLLVDDMFAYVENLQELTKKLLELISDYGNVASCKIIIQKSIAFLHSTMNK